jgi:hypothetical protein
MQSTIAQDEMIAVDCVNLIIHCQSSFSATSYFMICHMLMFVPVNKRECHYEEEVVASGVWEVN